MNLALMRRIDRQHLVTPWYGSRQMARHLRREAVVRRPQARAPSDALDGFAGELSGTEDVVNAS